MNRLNILKIGEPGYYSYKEVALVPTFDIPSEYIDENFRQLRFSNAATTDDHGIQIVGYQAEVFEKTKDYLIKHCDEEIDNYQ